MSTVQENPARKAKKGRPELSGKYPENSGKVVLKLGVGETLCQAIKRRQSRPKEVCLGCCVPYTDVLPEQAISKGLLMFTFPFFSSHVLITPPC